MAAPDARLCRDNAEKLNEKYATVKKSLSDSSLGLPLRIEAEDTEDRLTCHIYGVLNFEFTACRDSLEKPKNWCDILFLHPNIKTGVVRTGDGVTVLDVYCGRKYYQPPEDTYRLVLKYEAVQASKVYCAVRLTADKGPFFTRNYRIRWEAVPLKGRRTFVHLSYDYEYGAAYTNALRLYLNTIGRKKIGFTQTGTDDAGNPIYVKGKTGVIERNTVRYYFAIQAFMESLDHPKDERFAKRISRWYALTDKFKPQLYELSKKTYIRNKQRERQNQMALQKNADQGRDQ